MAYPIATSDRSYAPAMNKHAGGEPHARMKVRLPLQKDFETASAAKAAFLSAGFWHD